MASLKTVQDLLVGVHAAAAAEAIGLASAAGLDTQMVYDIIHNAAGNSAVFADIVPKLLAQQNVQDFDMTPTVDACRALQFPLPLGSAADQIHVASRSSSILQFYLRGAQLPSKPNTIDQSLTPMDSPREIGKIGVIGLGAMGQGMAASLVRAGFQVQGYDLSPLSISKFVENGGIAAKDANEAIRGADVVLLMVQNASQATEVLFGSGRGAYVLADGAVVVLSSTVAPSNVTNLDTKLNGLGRGITLVDAPVSGGVARAAAGTLIIISSGEQTSLQKVRAALLAMTGTASNLYSISGVGAASSVKLVNQLLAGVHIAAAAEAMALAARLGLDTRLVFEVVKSSSATSWMFENRVPQMLDGDWTPHSALAIFVKDLGIVLDEAKRLGYSAPITSVAHTLYLNGAAKGWTKESDAGVVRLWETENVSVAKRAQSRRLPAKDTIARLPREHESVLESIQGRISDGQVPTLVVLDDDPTGTQTCNNIDVLTTWDIPSLSEEFKTKPSGFFILTNSRALPSDQARSLILTICENVKAAAAACNIEFEIVLRGDSTLRGHLPEEPEAVETALGAFDAWILAPFFAQGGRLTIDDVHYVQEGDELVPASQTPFAQDATFGYNNSNLRHYVLEKCGSRFSQQSFLSITLEDIRTGGPRAVTDKLLSLSTHSNSVVIVNAVTEADMYVFVAGLLGAEKHGRRYLYRTGAAFVSSRLGISPISPLKPGNLGVSSATGGLIVAGSYVPKTTEQLRILRERRGEKLRTVELDVSKIVSDDCNIKKYASAVSDCLQEGQDVLIMTSRELITGDDHLVTGSKIAKALVHLVEKISTRPRYIIAKGGITSSDTATKALRMRRAKIMGQAAPGVPLWRCDEQSSRHAGAPYIVFPGNVGNKDTLADVVEAWAIDNS